MLPPDARRRGLAGEWFHKADKDMAAADALIADSAEMHANAIVFHCQQAAEKYLKGLLAWRGVDFPKTHDLGRILDIVGTADSGLSDALRDTVALTPYGVELRYPGDRPDASPDQARRALDLARMVRKSVCSAVGVV